MGYTTAPDSGPGLTLSLAVVCVRGDLLPLKSTIRDPERRIDPVVGLSTPSKRGHRLLERRFESDSARQTRKSVEHSRE